MLVYSRHGLEWTTGDNDVISPLAYVHRIEVLIRKMFVDACVAGVGNGASGTHTMTLSLTLNLAMSLVSLSQKMRMKMVVDYDSHMACAPCP